MEYPLRVNPHIVTCAGLAGVASGTSTGGEGDYLLDISDAALLELLDKVQLKGGSPGFTHRTLQTPCRTAPGTIRCTKDLWILLPSFMTGITRVVRP